METEIQIPAKVWTNIYSLVPFPSYAPFIDACRDACNIAEKSILTATIGTEVISIMDAHIAILNSLIVPTI